MIADAFSLTIDIEKEHFEEVSSIEKNSLDKEIEILIGLAFVLS